MNNIINKIKPIWVNQIFRYSLSFSLMISGILFSLISPYATDTISREVIPEIAVGIGFFLNPNLDINKFSEFSKKALVFFASIVILLFDLRLIEDHVLIRGSIVLYFLALMLTIILLAYYIYISYQVISAAFRKIKNNTNNIAKVFKYIGTAVGFLISVASFVKLILEIHKLGS